MRESVERGVEDQSSKLEVGVGQDKVDDKASPHRMAQQKDGKLIIDLVEEDGEIILHIDEVG